MVTSRLSAVELTRILQAWSGGDQSALDRLAPLVYAELRRLAHRNLAGERKGHLLQSSALVNEAFLRLIAGEPVDWASRAHFFALSARLMRQILIDFARAQDTGKRGHRSPHLDHRSLNIDTFNPIYVLMGHALPEEAQSRPVQRAGDAQAGVHPQVSNRGEAAHPSGSFSFGFAIRPV
jgi:RNA polymerase sigma factor (TIGR02999 family)